MVSTSDFKVHGPERIRLEPEDRVVSRARFHELVELEKEYNHWLARYWVTKPWWLFIAINIGVYIERYLWWFL